MSKSLEGAVALVTGGSRGIGRAICVELAAAGARVYINYASRADAAEETATLCREAGAEVGLSQFNVAQSSEVNDAVARIVKEDGKVDILVNNAGLASDGLSVRVKDEDWRKTMAVNLDGVFFCSRAVLKPMMKARKGRIINLSSVVGEMGNPGQAAYVAAKAGVIGLTKSLAKEFGSRGVTVNAITPGFIETDMTSHLVDNVREGYLSSIPLGKFGSAADVASLAVFLAGGQAAYITGQIIGVNGGLYM